MESLTTLFSSLLMNSWRASLLVGVILILQFLFKMPPPWRYALWLVLLVRLLLPVSFPAPFSLYNWAAVEWPSNRASAGKTSWRIRNHR